MKSAAIILSIAFVLAISGCTSVSNGGLSMKLTADPSPVFSGTSTVVSIDVDNTNAKSIDNVVVQLFNTGILTTDKDETCGGSFPRFLPMQFQSIICRLNAPVVHDTTDTQIDALVSFHSTFSAAQVFEAMSEGEYARRKSLGSYATTPKSYTYGDRYVRVDVDFSDSPPLVIAPDRKYFVYLTITDVGSGFLKQIEPGDLHVYPFGQTPNIVQCSDITAPLTPAGKTFPRLGCEVIVPNDYFAVQSFRNTGFVLQLDYNYELRDSLKISVVK